MPIIKSAKKRVKTATKATIRNSKTKRTLKDTVKLFGRKSTQANLSKAQSALDKAAKKGVIHKNKAARQKSKLAAKAKTAGVKSTAKIVTKKPAVKKAATKKPAAKKTTSKSK
jgi:small subunit ribosomal protein S20